MNQPSQQHIESWASGFIDGEGSFVIEVKRYRDGRQQDTYLRPKLAVHLRADDIGSLHFLQQAFGDAGYLYQRKRRKESTYGSISKPTVECTWHSARSLAAVCALLDRCPLLGKKAKDYAIWRTAVDIALDTSVPSQSRQEKLWRLRDEIMEVRKYVAPEGQVRDEDGPTIGC